MKKSPRSRSLRAGSTPPPPPPEALAKPLAPQAQAETWALPQFGPWQRLLLYPLCLAFPAAGLTLGALYVRLKPARGFALLCFGLAAAGILIRAVAGPMAGMANQDGFLDQPLY